ncbi:phosphoribosyltransferase [uncultured Dubosiella sp.]|uniref:ComF family protein n=1 Tax=uncultured Dubosiella sp. TaxID=1937011 RepID=UPI0025A648EB|nr:phosphoribosyltransferase [uncultured Dubosiella sp.]
MLFSKTNDGIFYLHQYYPTRYVEHSGVSESIIEFKQRNQNQINRFTEEMKAALLEHWNNDAIKLHERCLVVMPSHSVREWGVGLLEMAKKLCLELNMLDYSHALVRVNKHEKLSIGGDRSIDSHITTIEINPDFDVKGEKVVILDDVTTTGNSLMASVQILKGAGAKEVTAIAIGKTTGGTLST